MKKTNRLETLMYFMLFLVIITSLINSFILLGRAEKVKEARETAKEFLRPAEVEITKILLSDCDECFDIEISLQEIKKQNVNMTKVRTLFLDENEAKELVNKYNIKKIPALIISGEINKTQQLNTFFKNIGEEILSEKTIISTNQKPPYYDVSLNRIIGKVFIINIIDSSCIECTKPDQIIDNLKQAGIVVSEEKTLEYSSQEGKELINKLGIGRVPAILISDEINFYDDVKGQLQQLSDEKHGFYALHSTNPPYRDINEGKIVGLVKIILLTDNSCKECYDPNINKLILQRIGVFISNELVYDIDSDEGKDLISRYNIEKVPILLLSSEAKDYPLLVQAWKSAGSVEDDGWYVMRKPENLGIYKDLKSNNIIGVQ